MKKLTLLIVSILCFGILANAQGFIIKGGWNFSGSSVQAMKDGRNGWQAGVGYQTESSHGFSFQPELLWKVSGLKLSDGFDPKLCYLEVPLNVQWGPDLLIARPFVFGGPYLGYRVKTRFKEEPTTSLMDAFNKDKFEFGLGVGLGINVWKLQIAGRFNWNLGKFADVSSMKEFVGKYENLDSSLRTLEISVGLRF